MKKILEEIQKGEFAKEWALENQAGQPQLKPTSYRGATHRKGWF